MFPGKNVAIKVKQVDSLSLYSVAYDDPRADSKVRFVLRLDNGRKFYLFPADSPFITEAKTPGDVIDKAVERRWRAESKGATAQIRGLGKQVSALTKKIEILSTAMGLEEGWDDYENR